MSDKTITLLGAWDIEQLVCYFSLVVLFDFMIRFASSFLKALEIWGRKSKSNFWEMCWTAFKGVGFDKKKEMYADYWQPFVLGFLELTAFPVLMATGHWSYVGAWLGFKTLAQATRWKDDRGVFSRFLIGNGLVILASYYLASLVRLVP